MGLFSSIFGSHPKHPPEEKWDAIINLIHRILARERTLFFQACVEIVEAYQKEPCKNRTLTPQIELGILVYQLNLATESIAANEYVRPVDGRRFTNMLYAEALKYGSVMERDRLVKLYWPREIGDSAEIFCFYDDLAVFLNGGAKFGIDQMCLLTQHTGPRFSWTVKFAVANAFGDKETVERLNQAAKKL